MSRSSGRRGLVLVVLTLLVLAVVIDLLRPDSAILGAWRGRNPPQTPIERAVKEFTRKRPPRPPRSNWVEGERTRSVIPATRTPRPA